MTKHKYTFLSPLVGLNYDGDSISLSKNIRIRKIDEIEKKAFVSYAEKWQNIKFKDYLIECVISKETTEDIPNQYLSEGRFEIEKVLTTLRLFKEEIIGYNFILQPLGTDPFAASATHFRHYELWFNPPDEKYLKDFIIKPSEIDNLKILYNSITAEFYKRFNISFGYFNKSYNEPYTPRDSFLDLMFALENIYLRGDQLELGYKLRLRAAFVLAENYEDRKNVFEVLKKSYKVRGQIVHGEKSTNLSYDDLFELRNLVRKSFLMFLKDDINENKLDDLILNQ